MPERKGFQLPAERRPRPPWLIASVAMHVAIVAVLLRMYGGFVFGERTDQPSVIAIALPAPRPSPRAAAAPPASRRPTAIVFPREVPATPPALMPMAPPRDSGVPGGVIGGAGRSGLVLGPTIGDPRLFVRPMYIPEGGGRPIDMDSLTRQRLLIMADIADSVMRLDSLSPLRTRAALPRWTFERNGKTYGLDSQAIHFGSFSIPTALLAFLPFPQGNIDQARANARLMEMRGEILRAAARSMAEDDFRRAVQRIRERKDRERREARQRQDAERARNRDNDRPIP